MVDHESRVIAGLLRSARLTIVCADPGTDPAVLLRHGVLPLLRRRAVDHAVTSKASDSLIRRAVNVVIPFPDRRRSRDAERSEEPTPRMTAAFAEVVVIFDQWGPRPLSRLADAVAVAVGMSPVSSRLGEAERWARTLHEATQEHRPRLLLVLDRFEDLLDAIGTRIDATLFVDALATTLVQEPPRMNMLLSVTLTRDGPPGDDAAWSRRLASLAARCGPLDEHCVRLNADGRSFLLAEVERARAAAASRTMSAEAFRASIDAILMRSPPPGANDSRFIPSEFDAAEEPPAVTAADVPAAVAPSPTWTDPAEWLGGPVKRWPRPEPASPSPSTSPSPPPSASAAPVEPVDAIPDIPPVELAPATPAPRPEVPSLPPLDLRVRPIFVVAPAALLLVMAVVIRLVLGDGDHAASTRPPVAVVSPTTAPTTAPTPAPTTAPTAAPPTAQSAAPDVVAEAAPAIVPPSRPGVSSDGSQRLSGELSLALAGHELGGLRIVGFDALRQLRGRVLMPLYSSELLFVVRADSPLRSLRDMRGQRIDAGEPGGTAALAAARVHDRLFASGPPVASAAASPAKTVDAWLEARASDVLVVATDDAAAWLASLSAPTRAAVRLLHVDKTNAIDRRALQLYLPATVADGFGPVPSLSTLRFLVDTGGTPAGADDAAIATALCRALPQLQRDGHPKWREVQPALVVPTPASASSTAQAAWRACKPGR